MAVHEEAVLDVSVICICIKCQLQRCVCNTHVQYCSCCCSCGAQACKYLSSRCICVAACSRRLQARSMHPQCVDCIGTLAQLHAIPQQQCLQQHLAPDLLVCREDVERTDGEQLMSKSACAQKTSKCCATIAVQYACIAIVCCHAAYGISCYKHPSRSLSPLF